MKTFKRLFIKYICEAYGDKVYSCCYTSCNFRKVLHDNYKPIINTPYLENVENNKKIHIDNIKKKCYICTYYLYYYYYY